MPTRDDVGFAAGILLGAALAGALMGLLVSSRKADRVGGGRRPRLLRRTARGRGGDGDASALRTLVAEGARGAAVGIVDALGRRLGLASDRGDGSAS